MNRVERAIAQFPEYKFHGVNVPITTFYGQCVEESDGMIHIYFNERLSTRKKIETIIHEATHAELQLFNSQQMYDLYHHTQAIENKVKQQSRAFKIEYVKDILRKPFGIGAILTLVLSSIATTFAIL